MKLAHGDKLVMIGDSITDCGRGRPIGEGLGDGLGRGYVSLVDGLLQTVYPQTAVRIVNVGTSGNTVRDLNARWQTDVLDLKPDWLSVMIGTNDVWRQYDQPYIKESHVYADEYETTLDALVEKTKKTVKGIVLMTPFYLEPNKGDAMRATMDAYGAIVKRTAEKHGTLFVDTQAAFDKVLAHIYPATIAWDRVHPSTGGHLTLAKAFLDALDFSWNG
ncbi:SGNH/GDSL hydrolase family protein [Cohnella nanjingensis]|uniref:SGNH/GDSL hydrolase family protein n=1 Tax=Cohnella nanjingensis TaxID=1387779 RepID=A0A7X0RPG0_9BACL|nr:SGNH/GDSL hydrolase family protein [Cohnella nanjingensis]MBB6671106.1 SGNH/GDSL hydrolase family protein [Cohnella nanjingensis]